MSVLDRPELVPVPLGYCPCEGSPHPDGDTVYLYPELSMAGGMAARGAIIEAAESEYVQIQLNEFLGHLWMRYAVAAWTFLDDEGEPIPITAEVPNRSWIQGDMVNQDEPIVLRPIDGWRRITQEDFIAWEIERRMVTGTRAFKWSYKKK